MGTCTLTTERVGWTDVETHALDNILMLGGAFKTISDERMGQAGRREIVGSITTFILKDGETHVMGSLDELPVSDRNLLMAVIEGSVDRAEIVEKPGREGLIFEAILYLLAVALVAHGFFRRRTA